MCTPIALGVLGHSMLILIPAVPINVEGRRILLLDIVKNALGRRKLFIRHNRHTIKMKFRQKLFPDEMVCGYTPVTSLCICSFPSTLLSRSKVSASSNGSVV